jgi:4-diphosphocytidyl-2-C-methyl-D-erythritol kinase
LEGRRIFLFKPPLGFSTREVYARFADSGDNDSWSGKDMMKVVGDWEDSDLGIDELTRNDLQAVVFEKYPFMPAMFEILNRRFGSKPLMSGSGSCCFVVVNEEASFDQFALLVRESWGEEAFVFEARIRL